MFGSARCGLLVVLGLIVPGVARTQFPVRDTLAAVVVTATRVPMKTASPTATSTVLDGAELRAAGITRVSDALRLVPGASIVQSGPTGSQSSLFLRGGNSNYVRVLIDGVAVNEAGGAFDFSSLTTANIDRIEIVRGAASVLYGSDAVTGVIQLFTNAGRGTPRAHMMYGRGSRGATRAEIGFSGGDSRGGISFGAARETTNGILAFNNRNVNDVLSASVRVSPDLLTDGKLTARWSSALYQYPTDYTGAVVDHNSEQTDHRLTVGFDGGRRIGSFSELRLALSSNEYLPRTNDGSDSAGDTLGFYGYYSRAVRTRRAADVRLNIHYQRRGVLTLGAEFSRDRERSSSRSLSEYGPSTDAFEAARHNSAYFLQLLGDATSRTSYSIGTRLDRNSAFGTFYTARAAGSYILDANNRVRAAYGNAFKAPSFFENFATGFTVGNRQLRPERSRSAELGIESATMGGRMVTNLTGYRQWFTDVIQYAGTAPAPGAPNYYNIAAATSNGIELATEYRPDAFTVLRASYDWTWARATKAGFDQTTGASYVVGERLIRRPARTTRVSMVRTLPGSSSLSVSALRVGERADRDYAVFPVAAITLPSYTKIDLGAIFPLRGEAAMTVRIDNLWNASFEEVARYGAPGRTFFVGVRTGSGH